MSEARLAALRSLIREGDLSLIASRVASVIITSMQADKAPNTKAEVQRRFDICYRIIIELRGDMHWSLERIFSVLPRYLRCELDGGKYDPSVDGGRSYTEETDPLLAGKQSSALLVDPSGAPLVV